MTKKPAKCRVYPVEGRFILGFPHVEQEVDEDKAEWLVATGAFTTSPPTEADEAPPPAEEVTD